MDADDIPVIERFAEVAELDRYVEPPSDWLIAIADVQGSTMAIKAGRYKDVNLLGVSTIAAVVNAVGPLRIPFVFGGDGASFCIPPHAAPAVRRALTAMRALGRDALDLHLRIGLVPVAAVRAAGKRVLIAWFRSSPTYRQAVFAGGGMAQAERLVKDPASAALYAIPADEPVTAADCGGLECRWDEIPSPHGETVALLVQATGGDDAADTITYRTAIAAIDDIYGGAGRSHPVSGMRLALGRGAKSIRGEVAVRSHGRGPWRRWLYAVNVRAQQVIGRFLMAVGWRFAGVAWGAYKQEVIANTDRRKFDDTLRIILAGTGHERTALTAWLEERHAAGALVYGLHVAPASLMTCLIGDRGAGDHVHFVDGSDGGYALAAVDLKQRLKQRQTPSGA